MKILVTGATGFIGSSIVPKLVQAGHDVTPLSSRDYNLFEQGDVRQLFKEHSPEVVLHLAAKVGGILANKTYPAEFIYKNLQMNTYFLEQARQAKVNRLVYLFCGCAYPKDATNPIKEEYLFKGLPDENSLYYSFSKATTFLQVQAYRRQYGLDWISLIPGNAYGPNDNFSDKNSHVIPGLLMRFHKAKQNGDKTITAWGSGSPIRDFIYVEDVSDAILIALDNYHSDKPINISSGIGISIKNLTEIVKDVVGFEGEIIWDKTKPDGHPIKIFDNSRMKSELGYEPRTDIKTGITKTYEWILKNLDKVRE